MREVTYGVYVQVVLHDFSPLPPRQHLFRSQFDSPHNQNILYEMLCTEDTCCVKNLQSNLCQAYHFQKWQLLSHPQTLQYCPTLYTKCLRALLELWTVLINRFLTIGFLLYSTLDQHSLPQMWLCVSVSVGVQFLVVSCLCEGKSQQGELHSVKFWCCLVNVSHIMKFVYKKKICRNDIYFSPVSAKICTFVLVCVTCPPDHGTQTSTT